MPPAAGRDSVVRPTAPPDDVRRALERIAGTTTVIGHTLRFYDSVGSTNDIARDQARGGAPPGLVVVADRQTAGRGQRGRRWFSPPESGLYVSVLLGSPVFGHAEAGVALITLGSGVALAEALRSITGADVRLKWPNDLVVESADRRRRKLGGLLAEGVVRAGTVVDVVLGFGINVRAVAYPAAIAGQAISLEEVTGPRVRRGDVLAETLVALDRVVNDLAEGRVGAVLDRWRGLSPSASGSRVRWVLAGGAERAGTTDGIEDDGALRVQTTDGLERVRSADLTWD